MAQKIELLAPAKDYECGVAAINHGADAVYVGAPKFGARVTASNSLADIERLCRYAHLYHASVHVALNTILTDEELEEARKLIFRLVDAGADALIIQDTGILQLDIPPIALHASTQTDNRIPEKVLFWEKVGLQRAILARELSLEQIREIRRQTTIELEAFVHGALCVSYSGQCYMSHACTTRSANRGECAQFCRLPYTLEDADGNVIREHSHLLSLKDMDRSDFLAEMLDAGITSFKIEGRLKGIDYVKNVTAYYRQHIDNLLEKDNRYTKSSSGKVTLNFVPDPQKTFNRGETDYFLHGRENVMVNPDTPKSIGEPLGTLVSVEGHKLLIDTQKELHNGDGLGFVAADGELCGFRINKAEGRRVTTLDPVAGLSSGMPLYRNLDAAFDRQLAGESAVRKIGVNLTLSETPGGFALTLTDEDGTTVNQEFTYKKELSQKGGGAIANLKTALSKLGGTPFYPMGVEVRTSAAYFFPASVVNEWRRTLVERLAEERRRCHPRPKGNVLTPNDFPFPSPDGDMLTYRGNVMNTKAREFYKLHGIKTIEPAFERSAVENAVVMTCRHCIRYTLGMCRKQGKVSDTHPEPWHLLTGKFRFNLDFDCAKCEMTVRMEE